MAQTFGLWNNPAMDDPFEYNLNDKVQTDVDGDFVIYLGSPDSGRKLQAQSNPGVDPITLTPSDSNPGTGHEATEIKLATSQGNLSTAVAGDPLNLTATLNGGSAQPIWIRLTDGTGGGNPSSELSVQFNALFESAI